MNSKPLPPYGGLLKDLLLSNRRPCNDVFLFVGDGALKKAHSFSEGQFVMALVNGASPEDFEWLVDDMSVLICELSPQPQHRLKKLAEALFENNCAQIIVIRHDFTIEKHIRSEDDDDS